MVWARKTHSTHVSSPEREHFPPSPGGTHRYQVPAHKSHAGNVTASHSGRTAAPLRSGGAGTEEPSPPCPHSPPFPLNLMP